MKPGTPITVIDPFDPARNWNAILVSGPNAWGDCTVIEDRGDHPINLHRTAWVKRIRERTVLDKIVEATS